MDLGLEALTSASATGRDLFRPEFFRLALPADRERLHELLKRAPTPVVHDELLSQLAELVRALNPAIKFTKPELAQAAKDLLGAGPSEHYGVWVYYPWSGRLVHLLDEAEFVLVRTDRNRNKITSEEQDRLGKLRIGVIGLSVGQSICLTLALERGFGELRIADFDTLDLSNLNRIRSGVHSLGHLKTVNVAREIAELDPFLKVTLYNEGLTRDNIDGFLNDGGKLDILVDECDSVDVKILCRQRAKAFRIPVIMDTSDRGMLDVERFDLEPERPILHGLIDHLNPEDAAKAKTNEEKLPFVLPILNVDTLSKRMKASMLEIESSVTTWPQLASSVVLGGALGADIVRRIGLAQFHASGRWFVDLDELVHDESAEPTSAAPALSIPPALTISEMEELASLDLSERSSLPISEELASTLVAAGALAPSGGNSQPWRFLLMDGELFAFLDPARSFSTIDPGLVYGRLAMGACMENIRLKAESLGHSLEVHPVNQPAAPLLVARLCLRKVGSAASPKPDPLADYLDKRCTNRHRGSSQPIAPNVLDAMAEVVRAAVPSAHVHYVTDPADIQAVGRLCGKAERVRMLNPISHWDMFHREMRWTAQQASATGDGVDVGTLELSLSDRTGITVAADPTAVGFLRKWDQGRGFEKLSRGLVGRSAAIVIISVPDLSPMNAMAGGRAVQRLWLQATRSGLAVQPVSAPIFMGIHERFDRTGMFSDDERRELARIHTELLELTRPVGEPLFMMRLDHAPPPSVRSLRRPIGSFLHIHQPVHV